MANFNADYEYDEGGYPSGWDETSYREYIREEITQLVRSRLDSRFDQLEGNLKTEFLGIVKDVVFDVFKQHPVPRTASDQEQAGSSTDVVLPFLLPSSTDNSSTFLPDDLFNNDFQTFPAVGMYDTTQLDLNSQLPPSYGLELDIFSNINTEDSGYGSLEGSTGSPASLKE